MMNFISKAKTADSEAPTTSSTILDKPPVQPGTSSIARGLSGDGQIFSTRKKAEAPEPKSRGLKAFLVPKERLPANVPAKRIDVGPSRVTDVEEIDESVLAELPEDIRMEILKSRGINRVSSCADPKPSTSAAIEAVDNERAAYTSRNVEENNSRQKFVSQGAEASRMEDIDESVLNQLPEDIRKEILGVNNALPKKLPSQPSKVRQTQQETYFKHKKPTSGKSGKANMPPIEEIDMSVLIELPEEIRNEIINEYKANKLAREKRNDTDNSEETGSGGAVPTEGQNKRTSRRENVEDEANVSFSQVDPEFLAALSEDMKNDVQLYCMAKKKESSSKTITTAASNTAVKSVVKNKNRVDAKPSKKNSRITKSKNKTAISAKGTSNERRNIKKSPISTTTVEATRSSELGNFSNRDDRTKIGRLMESNFIVENRQADETLKQREEIILHHSSFVGNRAKSDEQEMLTNLVNYLFTLPVRQVISQRQCVGCRREEKDNRD